jgi:hypothetical protein
VVPVLMRADHAAGLGGDGHVREDEDRVQFLHVLAVHGDVDAAQRCHERRYTAVNSRLVALLFHLLLLVLLLLLLFLLLLLLFLALLALLAGEQRLTRGACLPACRAPRRLRLPPSGGGLPPLSACVRRAPSRYQPDGAHGRGALDGGGA